MEIVSFGHTWPDGMKTRFFYIGCRKDKPPIGIITLSSLEKKIPWIHTLLIQPENRRCGYGRTLMCEVIKFCKREKKESLAIWVEPNNFPAINLYKSLGFVRTQQNDGKQSEQYILGLL